MVELPGVPEQGSGSTGTWESLSKTVVARGAPFCGPVNSDTVAVVGSTTLFTETGGAFHSDRIRISTSFGGDTGARKDMSTLQNKCPLLLIR